MIFLACIIHEIKFACLCLLKADRFRSKASEVATIVDYSKTPATQEMDEFNSKEIIISEEIYFF